VLIEYGIPGLATYALLLVSAFYRARLRVLSAVGLFWFVFGGGYHLAPAIIYSLSMLLAWGPSSPVPAAAEPYRPMPRPVPL
jgi:hypothetical protein